MNQYQTNAYGGFDIPGGYVPNRPGNLAHQQMMKEVEAGEAEILAYVEPVKSVDQLRQEAYQAAGLTTEKMSVAMWEKMIEGRPDAETGIADMQAARANIKAQVPK